MIPPTAPATSLFAIITCVGAIISFYAVADYALGRFVRPILLNIAISRSHSPREIEGVVRGLCWTAGLVALSFAVTAALGVGANDLMELSISIDLLRYAFFGVLVGLGEGAAGSLLCLAVMGSRPVGPTSPSLSRSLRPLHLSIRLLVLCICAGAEECVLRGALLIVAKPHGLEFALVASVGVSIAVQAFSGTSGRRNIAPLLGALVSAPVHAILFLGVEDIRPLVLASVTATIAIDS